MQGTKGVVDDAAGVVLGATASAFAEGTLGVVAGAAEDEKERFICSLRNVWVRAQQSWRDVGVAGSSAKWLTVVQGGRKNRSTDATHIRQIGLLGRPVSIF